MEEQETSISTKEEEIVEECNEPDSEVVQECAEDVLRSFSGRAPLSGQIIRHSIMSCSSIILLICMFMAVSLATLDPDSTKERSVTESVLEVKQEAGEELGVLLDAGDGAVVTLEAGGTRLAVHRAVLAARSPALASMLRHHSAEASSYLSVPDLDGAALRHLLAYLYTLRAPRLPPGAATQLLAAAHRLGLPALQADCERQVAEQLSVETAASAAVLAVKHCLTDLRDAAINFIKDHFDAVVATKGWADAVENQPREVIKVTLVLSGRMAENCAPATTEAETTASIEVGTTTTTETGTTTTTEASTTTTTEAGTTEAVTTASSQPHSASQTPATAAPPLAACPTAPLDEATVSRLRSLSGEYRDGWLILAAEEGAVGELRALLAAGADVGARDKDGMTALHWAAARGRVEAASCLLGAGAQVDARNRWQRTPLHLAALQGHAAVVQLLLAASADPNARDEAGWTPLHWAAISGRSDVAAVLLDAGADRVARDAGGLTPLYIATSLDKQHLIEMLSQR